MSQTHFSCDTVDRELWLAILSSLLCPETDRNIRIGKQGYLFYLDVTKMGNGEWEIENGKLKVGN